MSSKWSYLADTVGVPLFLGPTQPMLGADLGGSTQVVDMFDTVLFPAWHGPVASTARTTTVTWL